jgi:flagellar hook protein FlgE
MLRSLSSAVSGLRNQQARMDVIGNNVSNVNTVAFKAGRVTFKEGFAQLLSPASRPGSLTGGVNPLEVGLGSQIGSIDTVFTQGNLETTGQTTDLAIQGSSFFIVKKGAQAFYTRAGNFQLDANGSLVSGNNGYAVQGRMATNGKLGDSVTNIQVPLGESAPASATTKVTVSGNLDASALPFDKGTAATLDALDPDQRALPQNAGSYKDLSITVYDSLGTKHELKLVLWKTDVNKWDWKLDDSNLDIVKDSAKEVAGTHPLTFASDGSLDLSSDTFEMPEVTFSPNSGADDPDITIDLGSATTALTQFAGASSAAIRSKDA